MLVTRSFACRAREGLMAIGNDWVLIEQVLVVNLAKQGVLESEHVHRVDFHLGERDVACHNDGSLVLRSVRGDRNSAFVMLAIGLVRLLCRVNHVSFRTSATHTTGFSAPLRQALVRALSS